MILFTLFHCMFPEESPVLFNWDIKQCVNDSIIISSLYFWSEMKMQRHLLPAKSHFFPAAQCWGMLILCPLHPVLASFPRAPRCWQLLSWARDPHFKGQLREGWDRLDSELLHWKKSYICMHTQAGRSNTNRNVAQRNHMLLDEIRSVCQVSGFLKTRIYLEIGDSYIQMVLQYLGGKSCAETEGRALALTQTHPCSKSGQRSSELKAPKSCVCSPAFTALQHFIQAEGSRVGEGDSVGVCGLQSLGQCL